MLSKALATSRAAVSAAPSRGHRQHNPQTKQKNKPSGDRNIAEAQTFQSHVSQFCTNIMQLSGEDNTLHSHCKYSFQLTSAPPNHPLSLQEVGCQATDALTHLPKHRPIDCGSCYSTKEEGLFLKVGFPSRQGTAEEGNNNKPSKASILELFDVRFATLNRNVGVHCSRFSLPNSRKQ